MGKTGIQHYYYARCSSSSAAMSFRAMWFGASAVDSSCADVAGEVRAPVANHCSMHAFSYTWPSEARTGCSKISREIGHTRASRSLRGIQFPASVRALHEDLSRH